jgi:hypothetical protein
VINEASVPADLYSYLEQSILKRLWSYMWLPAKTRLAWESRFPELAQISRLAST